MKKKSYVLEYEVVWPKLFVVDTKIKLEFFFTQPLSGKWNKKIKRGQLNSVHYYNDLDFVKKDGAMQWNDASILISNLC